ncbi:hypothetical protein SEA_LUZDEMUNDO_16 [Microbacterium phage LuzDeMundo]|nr:membrane protein [Microbacterium phage MuffinTheCat]QWY84669.1 hypothetical protein SEA_BADULIA_16 [Microbacterium phage Badulia]UJQ86507.1 membrane protein [Microbacterium phage DesireeRose]UVG34192.1 hypothetical protein SEA_LUZDEMUNDO_16 [Microbacterium phage LuzDeMundo]WGH20696.1 membrane protein [Microbacterium phage SCoupsA]WGH21159.1 membrane protein [Microbacterium phage Bee17]
MRKWVLILIIGLVGYVAWRKFGGKITSTVTSIAK